MEHRHLEPHAKFEHAVVSDVSFSPDSKLIVTRSLAFAGADPVSEVAVWDTAKGELKFKHGPSVTETYGSAVFSPNNDLLLVGTNTGVVRLIDLRTGKVLREAQSEPKARTHAAFSPDGKSFLTWTAAPARRGQTDGTLRLWNTETAKEQFRFASADTYLKHATFLPDGKRVVAYSIANSVGLWDTTTGKNVMQMELVEAKAVVSGVAVSANGEFLAVTGSEFRQRPGTTFVFASENGKELGRFENTRFVVFDSKRENASVAVVTATETGHAVTVRPVAEWLKAKAK